ncbi:cytochrome c oxidase subunit 8B, mitochondrial-like [Arapaima gigas]
MLALWKGLQGAHRLAKAKSFLLDQRSNIYSKPPKEKIGPAQSVLVMSVFAVALLAPAGWILHHIPKYRQKDALRLSEDAATSSFKRYS